MQEFTNVSYSSSEQQKELCSARMIRDKSDSQLILSKLQAFSPFTPESSLRNIVTGVTADLANVNVHEL